MIHKQIFGGIDNYLLNNCYVERIEGMVKDVKTHRSALEFDIVFLSLFVKENNIGVKTTY